jgi:hypothetical protein
MNRTGMRQLMRIGLTAVLALLAVQAVTGTAFANIEGLTINSVGGVSSGGAATVSGTLSCTPYEYADMYISIAQIQHGQVVTGSRAYRAFLCTGPGQTWSVTVPSFLGFKPGPAHVVVELYSYDYYSRDYAQVSADVGLRPNR